ncbi:N-acetylneuraminate lyase B isoform X1 [Lingula anatina]|uniref:N-acetylneuraminate lyase n=1 Tax=Lingula anatina TaxID=7574 RepID=A0A1S3KF98_LINAN|nr:N-acetylneuraminate lyase B isoform X1 [Lingula anatina]|eukprot:XP_013421162.1 N-acetylneuraminate lyase B isoform X1 [Lingula anatina]
MSSLGDMHEDVKKRLTGLCAAVFTPFTPDGEVNYDMIPKYVDHLVGQQVENVFINGTTGESTLLTVEERKLIAEAWIDSGRGRLKNILIHVGTDNLKDTKDLADHAESIKADAISIMPPVYFKPRNIKQLVYFCKEVASAAPSLPFFYYHIPGMTGVELNMEDFLQAAGPEIPTLCGIKYSGKNMMDATQCLLMDGKKYKILFGADEQLLSALAVGMDSAIGTTYNFMPRPFQRMIVALEHCDLDTARKEQYRAQALINTALRYGKEAGNVSVFKEIMLMIGLDMGPPRAPMIRLDAATRKTLQWEVEQTGFFQWIH